MVKERARLATFDKAKAVMTAYREKIAHHEELGLPMVCNAVYLPRELTAAYDVVTVPGEWYAATSGPSWGVDALETAEACGFPHEICPYSRMHIGSMIAGKGFLGEFPKPDVVIGLAGSCNVEAMWYEFVGRYFNVPYFVFDIPPVTILEHRESAEKDAIEFFVRQSYRYFDFMEQTIGQKLDEEKLINTHLLWHRSIGLWQEITELWQAVPSPLTLRSLLSYLPLKWGPTATTPEAAEIAQALRDEVAQRVKDGVSGIPEERMRVFWYGLVPYYHLQMLNIFEAGGAAIVGQTYWADWDSRIPEAGISRWVREWSEPTNVDECLRSMGKFWIGHMDYLGNRNRIFRGIERMKLANVDGVVLASCRMCRRQARAELDFWIRVRHELGIPTLFVEVSPADPRDYSKIETERKIDTFLEQVMAMKERKGRSA